MPAARSTSCRRSRAGEPRARPPRRKAPRPAPCHRAGNGRVCPGPDCGGSAAGSRRRCLRKRERRALQAAEARLRGGLPQLACAGGNPVRVGAGDRGDNDAMDGAVPAGAGGALDGDLRRGLHAGLRGGGGPHHAPALRRRHLDQRRHRPSHDAVPRQWLQGRSAGDRTSPATAPTTAGGRRPRRATMRSATVPPSTACRFWRSSRASTSTTSRTSSAAPTPS